METQHSLISSNNKTIEVITNRTGLSQGYCSFQEYYGQAIKAAEESNCQEHVDEGIYFLALQKINILTKGRIKDGEFIEDSSGKYYPDDKYMVKTLARKSKTEEFAAMYIYMVKRRTFGFYIGDKELIDKEVKIPLLKVLCDFNMEMEKEVDNINKLKKLAMAQGFTIGSISLREAKKKVIKKFFKKDTYAA